MLMGPCMVVLVIIILYCIYYINYNIWIKINKVIMMDFDISEFQPLVLLK